MKPDIRAVRAVANTLGMTKEQRDEFRAYVHKRKQEEGRTGSRAGDYTFQELLEIGKDFLDEWERL